ncbi:UDP-glucuronate 4-epimerase 1 [Turnera subulata]|uniref:UDP-glucuronate 4-epimerase 1 n=1 Tax=Turnera subulata TaxID=218843 RepID=A0A9Q0FL85_9ROSI|nr:UDP-glucuronate 4-epimerase 1 [Turnera subulata]
MPSLEEELFPSTPGKFKIERSDNSMNRQFHRCFASTSTMFLWALFLIALIASYLSFQSIVDSGSRYFSASWGGIQWEKQVRTSAQIHRNNGMSVLVTGAAGFVGTHVSMALRKRGDGIVGIDNFNSYYDQEGPYLERWMLGSQVDNAMVKSTARNPKVVGHDERYWFFRIEMEFRDFMEFLPPLDEDGARD